MALRPGILSALRVLLANGQPPHLDDLLVLALDHGVGVVADRPPPPAAFGDTSHCWTSVWQSISARSCAWSSSNWRRHASSAHQTSRTSELVGTHVVEALLLREVGDQVRGDPARRAPLRRQRGVQPPHPEADADVVVRSGPRQPGDVAEHLDDDDVEPLVHGLVELAQVRVHEPRRRQPQPRVVRDVRRHRHRVAPHVVVAEHEAVGRILEQPLDEVGAVVHLDARPLRERRSAGRGPR